MKINTRHSRTQTQKDLGLTIQPKDDQNGLSGPHGGDFPGPDFFVRVWHEVWSPACMC